MTRTGGGILVRIQWMTRWALAMVAATLGAANAQVTGRIVGPGATRLEIAVSPLAASGGADALGQKFAEVVSRNLTLSGYFRVLDSKAYIEGPTPVSADQINFANWSTLGAKGLVKGTITQSGGSLAVEVKLFDVASRAELGGQRYSGGPDLVPQMGRRFADKILEMVTGEVGPFDSRIAFASRRLGRAKEIFVMSVDGFDVSSLTSNRTINLAPSWSPDARSLLFTSFMDGNPSLYRMEVGAKNPRKVSAGRGLNLGGRFSPDGRSIAVSLERGGNSDIFLVDPEGQVRSQITKAAEIDVSPSWSPDGSRLAFVSARTGSPQVYTLSADGSDQKRVTFQGSYNTSPCWSPKGDLIAYVSRQSGFNVFTVNLKTNQVKQVTSQGNNEDPWFSPDGRYLVFSSTRVGKPALFLADVTGEHQVQLTRSGGDDTSPSWSPRLP
ncbi:MAG: Tol-Pal system beta propeller repeat protein TolB [Candidatus Binatia bacterium]